MAESEKTTTPIDSTEPTLAPTIMPNITPSNTSVYVNTTVWYEEKNKEDNRFNTTSFRDEAVTEYFISLINCMQGELIKSYDIHLFAFCVDHSLLYSYYYAHY